MPNIYAIRNDGYKFQQLDLQITDLIGKQPADLDYTKVVNFSYHNLAMADWWPKLDVRFKPIDDPNEPIPDICHWAYSTLVLSPKAYRLLGDLLKSWGELLPVAVEGETYYIFNCLTTATIKEELCEKSYYEGEELGLASIVFDEIDTVNKLIYKNNINACIEMFCGDHFKGAVESFGLSGLMFSEKLVEDFNS